MGAEPAQSEGAGAEKAVHYLDQFPERDQLLQHPRQNRHGALGGEVCAEGGGTHGGHPVHKLGHGGPPGRDPRRWAPSRH